MVSLDEVLDALDRFHQRATYGAVAGVIGRPPVSVLKDRPRNQRHSWVVNQETGMPTGYLPEELHPALTSQVRVMRTAPELRTWLARPS